MSTTGATIAGIFADLIERGRGVLANRAWVQRRGTKVVPRESPTSPLPCRASSTRNVETGEFDLDPIPTTWERRAAAGP